MSKMVDVASLIVYAAIVFLLVRPRSQGPGVIKAFGDAWQGSLLAATGSVPAGYKSVF